MERRSSQAIRAILQSRLVLAGGCLVVGMVAASTIFLVMPWSDHRHAAGPSSAFSVNLHGAQAVVMRMLAAASVEPPDEPGHLPTIASRELSSALAVADAAYSVDRSVLIELLSTSSHPDVVSICGSDEETFVASAVVACLLKRQDVEGIAKILRRPDIETAFGTPLEVTLTAFWGGEHSAEGLSPLFVAYRRESDIAVQQRLGDIILRSVGPNAGVARQGRMDAWADSDIAKCEQWCREQYACVVTNSDYSVDFLGHGWIGSPLFVQNRN